MHRPFWLRTLIAIWGLWFTTAVVEPAGLFACEMHGGRATPTASARGAQGHEAAMHSASGHAGHSVAGVDAPPAHGATTDQAPPSDHHGCCTCIGSCCQSMPVSAPSTAVALAAQLLADNAVAAVTTATRAVTRRPFDLPFANGPPAPRLV